MKKRQKLFIIIGAVILVGLLAFFLRNTGAGKSPGRPVTLASAADFDHWFGSNGILAKTETPGTYYFSLWCNISLTETAAVNNGHTVSLDMNGHTIKATKQIQAFFVSESAHLSLSDGSVETAGADANGGVILVDGNGCRLDLADMAVTNTEDNITGERLSGGVLYISTPKTSTENPAILTLSGNTVITGSSSGKRQTGGSIGTKGFCQIYMYSGTIQNGVASCAGNVLLADKSSLQLYDGLITGGQAQGRSATTGLGGNIDMRGNARLNIYGGTITGGTAEKNGGNIFLSNYGELGAENGLNLYSGTVSDGTAGSGGGNIFVFDTDSVFRMYGGNVSGGTCPDGGNIYLQGGRLILRGGTLTGLRNNTKNINGGNIFSDHGKITLYNGKIQNAMTNGCGANVYLTNGTMDIYGGTITSGCLASYDVASGGGNLYAKGSAVINMYGGLITRGRTNYDKNQNVSAAGGNVMLAEKAFMQMFSGEISDGIVDGSVSRGGCVYVYGQPKNSSPVFHLYGGEIRNGETGGTMRGMTIAAYGETGKTYNEKTGRATAKIFGGVIKFSGPNNSRFKSFTLYTNRSDMECLRIYDDSGMQPLNTGATVGACPDASHNVPVETAAPTCITPGWTKYTCTTCGEWYQITEKALGHSHIAGEAITLDGIEGWEQYACDTCGIWYKNLNEPEEESAPEEKYVVAEPLVYPEYIFTDTPDTMQLRQTAVQAARDLLSVQWCSPEGIGYYKTGSKKYFEYAKGMTFGGVMYSGASSGLFQFLEYYNFETGEFVYPGVSDKLKTEIGSACTDSLLWSWSTVSNSFSCAYFPSAMVQKNGFLTVGEYTYDPTISSYYQLPTKKIIENNGNQVMARSYAQMLPADILVSSTADHSLMVIEAPYVQLAADGTVDTAASYVMIQDQRGGVGTKFYEELRNGHLVHHSGRISQKFSFDELLKEHYIPMTAAEFVGEAPYEAPEVTVEGGIASNLAALAGLTIRSNYPIAVINIDAVGSDGTVTNLEKILFNGLSEQGVPRSYALADSTALKDEKTATYDTLRIVVTTSSGKRFTPIELKLN